MLVNKEGRAAIIAAVQHAERQSRAEFVFCETPISGDYTRWFVLPVMLATIALATAVHFIEPQLPTMWLVVLQVPIAIAFWMLSNVPSVSRWLIPDAAEIAAVHARACSLFAEHELYETPQRLGVLVLVSTFERRVYILADRGLTKLVDAQVWPVLVALIGRHIRAGTTAQGVCDIIEDIRARVPADDVHAAPDRLPNTI